MLADSVSLSADEWMERYSLEASLMEIFKGKELFWQRRGGQNWLLKGDANIAYFQDISNGHRWKCSIPYLWDGKVLLEHHDEITTHIYAFYKDLFIAQPRSGVSLVVDFWPTAARVSDLENAELTLPFLPDKVDAMIVAMKAGCAP